MTEKQLQQLVLGACRQLRLLAYHTYDSRKSQPGFPDLVIVGGTTILYRELKTEKGKVTSAQNYWLDALRHAGIDADVWRPSDWPDRIMAELQALPPALTRPLPDQAEIRRKLASRARK